VGKFDRRGERRPQELQQVGVRVGGRADRGVRQQELPERGVEDASAGRIGYPR
jgi:hypothetical protein